MRKIGLILAVALSLVCFGASTVAAQSLWGGGGASDWGLFSDRRAHNVGDILSIIISERTTLTNTKSYSNEKSGSQNLGAGSGIFDVIKAAGISGSDEFSADGASTATNRVTANVAVTIVDVEPNGNLVIEGTQSIWQGRDENKITIRGVVRPDDVNMDNTVLSTKIANATVKFDGKGPLNAKQRQGILTQIFNFLF